MNHRRQPERRTFLQDRFDILIKRQKTGKATFSELTELDEMINRDPELREKVIREDILMEKADDYNEPSNGLENENSLSRQAVQRKSFLDQIKAFFIRMFTSKTLTFKNRIAASFLNQTVLI